MQYVCIFKHAKIFFEFVFSNAGKPFIFLRKNKYFLLLFLKALFGKKTYFFL